MPQGVGSQPQQGQQPPAQGGLPMSQAQQMAVPQFTGQEKPFGWLNEIVSRVMGQGPQPAGQPQGQPGQPGQPQGQPGQKPLGKQSQGQPQPGQTPGQPPVPGGMIDPSQAPALANVIQPQALQNLGLMPQSQGDFGWVLSAMQHAQQMGEQKGGTNIAQILQKIVGGAGGGAEAAPGAAANSAGPAPAKVGG